ncbi:MAG: AMP-binding protein [Planctomycetia bacterium]|nr:AMP-binding protein [Planctomycetia bacterium]
MNQPEVNVARRLAEHARRSPDQLAVVEPAPHGSRASTERQLLLGRRHPWRAITQRQLDADADRLAAGLIELGVTPGMRLVLLVRPGIDFVALVLAMLRSGATVILIDPGMGRRNLVRCLAESEPEGFVAISIVQAVRAMLRGRFPKSRIHVTVGRRWGWAGVTLDQLRLMGKRRLQAAGESHVRTTAEDPAAIIFTTGSTGPPKGTLYSHANFDHQVTEIRDQYAIEPGGVDISGFPLFALFNSAMGVTTVFPRMDFTRPADVDPAEIVAAVEDFRATQMFGSPALCRRVGEYCREKQQRLPTLQQVFSAGAPVPGRVLAMMQEAIGPEGTVHTPYGATEALPVATISAAEVLGETQAITDQGGGVCVGRKFPGIEWQVVRIVDGAIPSLAYAEPLSMGDVGELIVCGPVVTRQYATRREFNDLGKISDGPRLWHRMGDVGRLDEEGRFWFYGRLTHRVVTAGGTLFTIACEAIFNTHPRVFRTALVGVGPKGTQRPVIVVELQPGRQKDSAAKQEALLDELRQLGSQHAITREVRDFLIHPKLPVDIRHNAKIFREKLGPWAAGRISDFRLQISD